MGAETIAEVLNQLIDPLSYKTMAVGILVFLGAVFAASSAIGRIWGQKHPAVHSSPLSEAHQPYEHVYTSRQYIKSGKNRHTGRIKDAVSSSEELSD